VIENKSHVKAGPFKSLNVCADLSKILDKRIEWMGECVRRDCIQAVASDFAAMLRRTCGTGWFAKMAGEAMISKTGGATIGEAALELPDFLSFRRQERVFAGLNLALLAFLCLTQFLWEQYLGAAHPQVLALLGVGIVANIGELLWLNLRRELGAGAVARLTWAMIAIHLAIAFGIASYSYKKDVQYFALMIPAILQAAFRLSLGAVILTIAVSDGLIFFWVWNYFRVHPPVDPNEYVGAGTVALIYAVIALLVWTLVNHLRRKQLELTRSLVDLEKAEAKLLIEEKLAAVGRFSSAIAHEIRNPVAMISSALATAAHHEPGTAESQEMYEIATKEAGRLERLTTDFLAYARPRSPSMVLSDVADSVGYIAEICRPRAAEQNVEVRCDCAEGLWAEVDGGQLQQALLNLAMNAVEASLPGGTVILRGRREGGQVCIDIENGNGPIPAATVACIFEPFFTTKPSGTGLGMAIARNITMAHGGDLALAHNDAKAIRFVLSLPLKAAGEEHGP
jgi:signal transduction histidine kinase